MLHDQNAYIDIKIKGKFKNSLTTDFTFTNEFEKTSPGNRYSLENRQSSGFDPLSPANFPDNEPPIHQKYRSNIEMDYCEMDDELGIDGP